MIKIALDIETTGLRPWYGDRITCICAEEFGTIIDGKKFKMASNSEEELLKMFMGWISNWKPEEIELVTANGRDFDIPFLMTRMQKLGFSYPLTQCKIFDLVNDITSWRVSLNNIAKLYSLPLKTASGKDAIQMFAKGQYSKLIEYCWSDVQITKEAYRIYMMLKNDKK